MQREFALLDTSIGKKAVMAFTGLILFGFVIGHMLGNLQVYLGPEQLNHYAARLHELGLLLWTVRIVIAASIILHFTMMFLLYYRHTWGARPERYRVRRYTATNYTATTMWLSGVLILLFLLFHLAQFTYPGISFGSYEFNRHGDVYENVVNGFSIPWVAALYVAAQVALGLHMYHGGWSLLQTLGLNHPSINERRRTVARAIAAVVVAGNISMPIGVLAGIVNERGRTHVTRAMLPAEKSVASPRKTRLASSARARASPLQHSGTSVKHQISCPLPGRDGAIACFRVEPLSLMRAGLADVP